MEREIFNITASGISVWKILNVLFALIVAFITEVASYARMI